MWKLTKEAKVTANEIKNKIDFIATLLNAAINRIFGLLDSAVM